MIKTDKLWELETLSYLKNDKYGIYRKNINKFHVVRGFPNIVFAPNMTQNAERKHRTQNTNTAHFRTHEKTFYFYAAFQEMLAKNIGLAPSPAGNSGYYTCCDH